MFYVCKKIKYGVLQGIILEEFIGSEFVEDEGAVLGTGVYVVPRASPKLVTPSFRLTKCTIEQGVIRPCDSPPTLECWPGGGATEKITGMLKLSVAVHVYASSPHVQLFMSHNWSRGVLCLLKNQ